MKIITHVNGICGTNTYLIINDGKAVVTSPSRTVTSGVKRNPLASPTNMAFSSSTSL